MYTITLYIDTGLDDMHQSLSTLTDTARGVGRPTKYDKAYGDKLALELHNHLNEDNSVEEACLSLGFSKATFYKLCSVSPNLNEVFQSRVKPKAGRPTLFTKQYADSLADGLPQLFIRGQSLAQVAKAHDMSKDSFKKLCDLSPDFAAAYAKGQSYAEAYWWELGAFGVVGAKGIKFNAPTWQFIMKARFGYDGTGETNITIDVSNKMEITRTVKLVASDDHKEDRHIDA